MQYASIVFPRSPTSFTYEVNLENLEVGDLVEASFRSQKINGIVLDISKQKPPYNIKPLEKIVRKNVLTDFQLATAKFISEYYSAHLGKTLRLFIPQRVWENRPLKRKAKSSQIKPTPQPTKKLTSAQAEVLKKILPTANCSLPTLLHGITASGKTEIYLRVILETIKAGKQAILLVPEIALTPQLVGYFAHSIPKEKIAVIHSHLSEGEKLTAWEKIHSGEIQLVIGSRSALFAPARNIGVIILDEEHEWTYKNDQNPRYHARAVAWKIAELTKAKLILGSATPSVESYHAAQNDRVQLLELPERINQSSLPEVKIVDLRNEMKMGNSSPISEALQGKIREKLDKKEQVILLLNKRGYSSSTVCRDCGFVLNCKNCSLPLTFHRIFNRCICHACNYSEAPPTSCPNCKSVAIRYLGAGTQKIENELHNFFPKARILRADRDTTTLKGSHQKIYETFRDHEADILIGTQMIAKGLDLPNVSLVGVLLADIGLHFPDFRAGEKVFSLLTQVAGRCGRGDKPGEVIIQTYSPDHLALVNAKTHNYKKFFEEEIQERKSFGWPPFQKIVKFIFVNAQEKIARGEAEKFAQKLKKSGEKNVWMAPALITKLHNKFHYHVIWRGRDPRELLKKIQLPEKCRVDVDPVSIC